jgi:hypothetical protein
MYELIAEFEAIRFDPGSGRHPDQRGRAARGMICAPAALRAGLPKAMLRPIRFALFCIIYQ